MRKVSCPVSVKKLRRDIDGRIERLQEDCKHDKHITRIVEIGVVNIAASGTIIIGIPPSIVDAETTRFFAIIATSITTILAGWGSFARPERLWQISTRALIDMYELRDDFDHAVGNDNEISKLSEIQARYFYARYKAILARRNEAWAKLRGSAELNSHVNRRGGQSIRPDESLQTMPKRQSRKAVL